MELALGDRQVKWPEFVSTMACRREPARAVVCPIVIGEGEPCFAVQLDRQWLCGSQGNLTFFDSREAADRFLSLIRIDQIDYEKPRAVARSHAPGYQCFRLTDFGLTACAQCRFGEASLGREIQEHARQSDRW